MILSLASAFAIVGCDILGGSTPTPVPTPAAETSIPISAKGIVQPIRQSRLSFLSTGQITRLPKAGDRVEVGQEIASIQSAALDLAVVQAEDAVAASLALLEQAKAPARAVDLAALEAAFAAAQAQHDQLLASPSAADLNAAKSSVTSAEAALEAAKARQSALKSGTAQADILAARSAVRSAEAALATAKANHEKLQAGPSPKQREASAAQVAQAKALLDQRKASPPQTDLAVLEAQVKQARTALDQAKRARQAAFISAPLGGVVVWVGASVGDTALVGSPVAVVADISELVVETTDLDESSATRLAVGNAVKVLVNALDERAVDGLIESIAPIATTTPSGDAYYAVTIKLANPDPALRLGMTTKVEFAARP